MDDKQTGLSIVVLVYNEEANLPVMHDRLHATVASLGIAYEVVWVNDGSSDNSLSFIKDFCKSDDRNRFLSFSRNFGHQNAIMAGLTHCKGAAAAIIDSDLQDPPEVIPQLWETYQQGSKVVYAKRISGAGESWLKKITARLFYRLLKKVTSLPIPLDTGDFRLIDHSVIEALKQMPEQHKFLRGQIAWIGFKQTPVHYHRDSRYAGKTSYTLLKQAKLALSAFTAFSNYPLRFATLTGFAVSGIAFLIILYALYSKFVLLRVISGWTSLIISTMFIGGVQLITIGIIGEYISKINADVRQRPLYIIEECSAS